MDKGLLNATVNNYEQLQSKVSKDATGSSANGVLHHFSLRGSRGHKAPICSVHHVFLMRAKAFPDYRGNFWCFFQAWLVGAYNWGPGLKESLSTDIRAHSFKTEAEKAKSLFQTIPLLRCFISCARAHCTCSLEPSKHS